MDDTIERNIALSRPDAQFEEIVGRKKKSVVFSTKQLQNHEPM